MSKYGLDKSDDERAQALAAGGTAQQVRRGRASEMTLCIGDGGSGCAIEQRLRGCAVELCDGRGCAMVAVVRLSLEWAHGYEFEWLAL